MAKRKKKFGYSRSKTPIREYYDRVLIVCEGSKTEINYFEELIKDLKLSSVNIHIPNIKETTPDSLFNKAKELYQHSTRQRNPFDKVYCVFDKNGHLKYQETKNRIDQKKPKDVFYYAFSEPCFEFWLLLHFIKTDRPFTNFIELSKYKYFKKYFPNYEKSKIIFNDLKGKIPTACQNAKHNQHTNVNELVEYLQNIKKR